MAGKTKKRKASRKIETTKHKDKRTNIPTEELRDFVKESETSPKPIFYPRDPSLDPQLVWTGKDQQDQQDLEVPAVPIYIQEKIHPQAIIEDLRKVNEKKAPAQMSMFSDFNGIEFEDLIEFYQHEANWSNRMILGDSLLVMTSLAEKERLKGKVQMIYIDPPYGIKFGSNWQVSTRKRDLKDTKIEDVTRQPEQIRAFRDTWKLGIHSYLSYLRDRLFVSRELLSESGSIFVQISDKNVHLVRCILDEVFGSGNFVSLITFQKTGATTGTTLAGVSDYLLWYSKNAEIIKYHQLYFEREINAETIETFPFIEDKNVIRRKLSKNENIAAEKIKQKEIRLFQTQPLHSQHFSPERSKPFTFQGKRYEVPNGRQWATSFEGLKRLSLVNRIEEIGNTLRYIRYLDEAPAAPISNLWNDTASFLQRIFVVQTNEKVIQRCLLMTTDPGDLVLDPTCGSGTTAHVAEQWGRRWITIDTSRVALALARMRLMSARFSYYLLSDSPEGIKKEAEITGKVPPHYKTENDLKKGFVYKRVPHITLKTIANNSEVDVFHSRWQEKLKPAREKLNKILEKSWEEWEIPRESDEKWPETTKKLLAQYWTFRQQRHEEIDKTVIESAYQQVLYDQPYEDKRIRVTGPFTVESLSPHRVISTDQEISESEKKGREVVGAGQFESMILENLKKSGVQNTIKNERLKFDRLDTFAGTWIQAEGEYTGNEGTFRRAAIAIGPENGTVGPELVKEAAKEAVKGVGFDILIVCGFAFDPHVSEEAKRYGTLSVLPCRMNPDLSMGNELLKKTGAGNLFMVFGEPDIKIKETKTKQFTVEIRGLDIYDPTTGEIRSNTTDDIACWFIDTAYNEESFFVRHAYFTGADKPYDKLKRVLKAEVDEEAWSSLYTTKSRPFDPPNTGKIAVKVINHYGDEVLKVYKVGK